jgi:hypothetical protein
MTQVCCRSCGIKLQLGSIAFSALFGLWGIPFCWVIPPLLHSRGTEFVSIELWGLSFRVFITPLGLIGILNRINFGVQVLRNLRGIAFGPNPRTPSAAREEAVRSRIVAPDPPRARRAPRLLGGPDPAALESRSLGYRLDCCEDMP